MARRTLPNQRKAYKELNKRLNGYTRKVVAIYSMLAYEGAKLVIENDYDGEKEFHFSDYPKTKKKVNNLFQTFRSDMQALIYSGISDEWKRSNALQDLLANDVLKGFTRTIGDEKRKLYYDPNNSALEAFKKRKNAGLTISQRLWKQTPVVKKNLERALSTGIAKGVSVVQLSKRVTKYLNDYSSLSRDYRKKYGKALDISGCEYRSVRLVRNEINLAYRTAEQERWKKMDYIKGKRIRTTQNLSHKTDMCDALAGDYPKDFLWIGWHVNCMCYAVPIVMSEEEYWNGDNVSREELQLKELPDNAQEWMSLNRKELTENPPYWISDNGIILEELKQGYVLTENDTATLLQAGFNNILPERYNSSAMKGFDIVQFDSEFEQLCDQNKIRLTRKELSVFNNGNTEFVYRGEAEGCDFGDVELRRSFRKLRDGRIIVNHDLFVLPEELQGKGLGKSVMCSLYKQYKKCDVNEIRLLANKDVGGYAWARYGFSLDYDDALYVVRSNAAATEVVKQYYALHGQPELIPMRIVADQPYGKELLLGRSWDGVLNLDDKVERKYFESYIKFDS